MKKEKYVQREKELYDNLQSIKHDIQKLRNDYILANQKFKEGEKIYIENLKGEKTFGFINKAEISYNNNITYKLFKMKKDGTPSKHELWSWRDHTLNKVED